MKRNDIRSTSILLVALVLGSCAGIETVAVQRLEALRQLKDTINFIVVEGCVALTPMETFALYDDCRLAESAEPAAAIDVSFVGFDVDVPADGGVCMRIIGDYIAFGPNTLAMGYYFGPNGHLQARQADFIPCESAQPSTR